MTPADSGLQTPYWAHVDWMLLAGLLGSVGAFSSPFLLAWWNRRLSAGTSRAQAAETQSELISRQRTELYAVMEKRAKEAEAEITVLAAELDVSRAQARAMEEWAHWARHGWLSCKSRYRAFRRVVARANESPSGFMEIKRLLAITKARKIPVAIPTLAQAVEKTPPDEPEEVEEVDDLDYAEKPDATGESL